VKLVLTYDVTGAVYLSSTLVSTRLIFCIKGQKGEFVKIALVFCFYANEIFSAQYSFYTITNYEGAQK
jgi:hypothetical protein